ncbi:NACHT domain-containing NTPase [Streptomyces sp. VRA16 Mangrove soil]|uniref:NACHT domain-containing protein n=1 Tax=Streptomyces sp. VRA16 Mangrove soil TaxID=2817434 RepID=UPI001A9E915F|nr:NACHT domain-containing protein [Streptomyces sp. VRA16 Mangrove soil]MBO1333886.1 NACHT domain-containing protein [Streptomyces sp. VRA16 Mangrove soil]
MDPAVLGTRMASAVIGPVLRKLLVQEGPGAGLTRSPVRISGLVTFRGEKATLAEKDVRLLVGRLVAGSVTSSGTPPFPLDETTAVGDALTRTLLALGDLTMDDVQAVRLGHRDLARRLRAAAPAPGLSADAGYFVDSATEWACLHILQFFTQRSTFVARTLVEQSRGQAELIAKIDEVIARTAPAHSHDRAFETRYRAHLTGRHNRLMIFGLDLRDSDETWPLDLAYLSLEARADDEPEPLPDAAQSGTPRLTAEESLAAHDRVLLRGEAGSGKTTLVQWLAVTTEDRVPYVLPLRTLIRAARLPAPAEFLAATDCPHTPPDGWAERVLTDGRALVLVDGLDEVPSGDRVRVRDWLLALVRAYPGNRWLLTARPTAVRPGWLAADGFGELTLAPMDRGRVTAFVRRWHTAAGAPEHEEPLLDALRAKPDLAALATNPLMCGLICALHRARRGYLPPRRKALYDAALQMILTERDRQRGMAGLDGIELETDDQLELLQRLAYSLVLAGRTEMDEETALALLERALPSVPAAAAQGDAPAILRHLLLRSGVLRSPAPRLVDFAHRTFLDHLAARYAVEEGHLDVLLGHADDTQWEDVLRMAVAHARTRERTRLLRGLLAPGRPRLALLALACLQDAAAVDQEVAEEVRATAAALIPPRTVSEAERLALAGPLLLELLPGPDGLTDAEAHAVTVTASLLGREGALPVLKRFRGHGSLPVRRQLVGTWHRFDAQEYADEVLAHLDRDRLDLTVRTREQWAAARTMPPWQRLDLLGPYTWEEILAGTDPDRLVSLILTDNPRVHGLRPLDDLPALRTLSLIDCPGITDLTPLARTDLGHLGITRQPHVRGLPELTGLTSLTVSQPLTGTALTDGLPRSDRLRNLYLTRDAITATGLRGLSGLGGLTYLSVSSSAGTLEAADWAEIAAHPTLTSLFLAGDVLPPPPLPELPGITGLGLHLPGGPDQFAAHAALFPAVRTVEIFPGRTADQDPAAYRRLFPDADVTFPPR